jgi:predicted RNA-binding Zn-ribbon protein involved in translation (DUF1610 family)
MKKMKKKKKPRFYCDSCGTEVAASANCCPRCGKFFSSIRCPKCFWTGDQEAFANGCPNCGYSTPGTGNRAKAGAAGQLKSGSSANRRGNSPVAMPSWFYIAAISFFVLIFALLLSHIAD